MHKHRLFLTTKNDPYQMKCLQVEDIPEKEWNGMMEQLARWIQQTGDNWYEEKVQSRWIPYDRGDEANLS